MLAGMSDRFSAVEAYQNALVTGDVDAVASRATGKYPGLRVTPIKLKGDGVGLGAFGTF